MNENRSGRCSTQGIRKREPQNRLKENIGMELIVIKINWWIKKKLVQWIIKLINLCAFSEH